MAAMTDLGPQSDQAIITSAIARAVNEAVAAEIERHAEIAAEKVRQALRGRLTEIAGSVLSHFDMTTRGLNIVITIDTRALGPAKEQK